MATPQTQIRTTIANPTYSARGAECALRLPKRNRCRDLTVDRLIENAQARKACYETGNGSPSAPRQTLFIVQFRGKKQRAFTRIELEKILSS